MHNRFLELYGDYFSTRFRDAYGGPENFDPSNDQPENSQKFGEHLVNRIMAENLIKKEDATNKIIRKRKRNDCDKVMEILIAQLDQSKQKKTFEKMTSLLGIT